MPYEIVLEADNTYRMLAPDGTEVASTQSESFSESWPALWKTMYDHASANGLLGEALATLGAGFEYTDKR